MPGLQPGCLISKAALLTPSPVPRQKMPAAHKEGSRGPGCPCFYISGCWCIFDVCVWDWETVTAKNTDCITPAWGQVSVWAFLWFIDVFLQVLELLHDRHFWVPPFLPFAPLEEYALKPTQPAACQGNSALFRRGIHFSQVCDSQQPPGATQTQGSRQGRRL